MARILVIDDEDIVRHMLRTVLELQGYEVIEAKHGKEALQLQQISPPELVITDILMPENDGIEVILALRRQAPKLKVIAMSGGGRFKQADALETAELLGAVATLRKPFNLALVIETVKRALAA